MKEPITLTPEIQAAKDHLERHYQTFGQDFCASNAIDKSAELSCTFFEEDVDWTEEKRQAKSRMLYAEWT